MSAEVIVGTATGVGMAGAALIWDQNIAMAAAGGVAIFLGVTITAPLEERIFLGIGSFVLGYLVGLLCLRVAGLEVTYGVFAFAASALGSAALGSLNKWANGGPMPGWVEFFSRLIPFRWKKDGGADD